MDTAKLSQNGILGFFELDDSGNIRYSRTANQTQGAGDDPIIGQNFFELDALTNRTELKRLFRRFVESRDAADSFTFDCLFHNSVVHTKITLTRAFQTEFFPPESIVMLSIKESGQ